MNVTLTHAMDVIPNMRAADYHAHHAVSKSLLDQIARSPMHARAYLDGVRPEPTPAMLFGTALHCAVLEPARFAVDYAVLEGDRRTSVGKAAYAELQARGATVISRADSDAISTMVKAVRHHPVASKLLRDGRAEQSVFWNDPVTGLQCKCRPDWWTENGTLLDIKTTEDASPAGFARSMAAYRYHVQAAHYMAGVQAERFLFLAIEKKAPYAVAIYELDAESLDIGRRLRMRDLQTFASCDEFGVWPGYAQDIQLITLPKWATSQEIEA